MYPQRTNPAPALPRTEVSLRPAVPGDLPGLIRLKSDSVRAFCSGSYSKKIVEDFASCPGALRSEYQAAIERGEFTVALRSGEAAGYLWMSGVFQWRELMVDPEHARRGIGSALLLSGIERLEARGVSMISIDATLNAVPFYKRHGFRKAGRDFLQNRWTGSILPVMRMTKELGLAELKPPRRP